MEILLVLAELVGEVLLQFVIEIFAEFGVRGTSQALGISKPKRPLYAGLGYVALAVIIGFVSVWLFPEHLIKHPDLRLANLILAPLVVGGLMGLRRRMLLKKGVVAIRLDSFSYGFLFALVFSSVRFLYAG